MSKKRKPKKKPAASPAPQPGTPKAAQPGKEPTGAPAAAQPAAGKLPGKGRLEPKVADAGRLVRYSLIVVVAALAAYAQTLTADFTYDDIPIVRDNIRIRSLGNIPDFFKTNYWGLEKRYGDKSLYRPLTLTTYALNHAIHGVRPAGYHLINILLHALASFLLLRIVYELFDTLGVAFAAGLWFAVHPIHTEVVSGVVGRAELLAFAGIFLCTWCYFRGLRPHADGGKLRPAWWLAFSVLAYLAGMLSKETGMIAPAVIVLSELVAPGKRRLLKLHPRALAVFAGYVASFALYSTLRAKAVITKLEAIDFADLSAGERMLTGLRVCAEYVGLLVFPGVLSAAYAPGDLAVSSSLADPGVLLALLLAVAGIALVAWSWRRLPVACWGILLFLGALFPLSNLPFAIGVMKAERLLYTPSAGFLVAIPALLFTILSANRRQTVLWGVVYVVAAALALRTVVRNVDWHDNFALATATLKTSPSSQNFRTVLVNWHREHGRDDLARELLAESARSGVQSVSAVYNLANIELDAKNYAEAITLYRRVLEADPMHVNALNNLGRAREESGDTRGAVAVFRDFLERAPDSPGPYVNLMHLYLKLNDAQSAEPLADEALRRFPKTDAVYWNAGAIYQALGREKDAQAAFARARKLNSAIESKQDVRVGM